MKTQTDEKGANVNGEPHVHGKTISSPRTRFEMSRTYGQLLRMSLKGDLVAVIFVFGWMTTLACLEVLSFQFGMLTAQFYALLPWRDWNGVYELSVRFGTFVVLMGLTRGVASGTSSLLARAIRRNLTRCLHEQCLSWSGLHAIYQQSLSNNAVSGAISSPASGASLDSPDQRITEDVAGFSRGVVAVGEVVVSAPLLVCYYTAATARHLSGWSVLALFAHFFGSLLLLRLAMRPLRDLAVRKERQEAAFRTEHVGLWTGMEGILLTRSPGLLAALRTTLETRLERVMTVAKQLLLTEGVVEGAKTVTSYSGTLLGFLLMAGETAWGRWRNEADPSAIVPRISVAAFLALYLLFQLSRLAGLVDSLALLNAHVLRLWLLLRTVQHAEDDVQLSGADEFAIHIDRLSVASPAGRRVLQDVSLAIRPGEHVLIVGANGTGKTSLLRMLAGVWPVTSCVQTTAGQLTITPPSNRRRPFLLVCPQRPVVFSASLLQLLALPATGDGEPVVTDEETPLGEPSVPAESIRDVLDCVGLGDAGLVEDMRTSVSAARWMARLTPGQLHRLALARVLLHRPHLALLDETFATLDSATTSRILQRLANQQTTVVLVASTAQQHGGTLPLQSFFKHTLQL